jgi:hypothetical protein
VTGLAIQPSTSHRSEDTVGRIRKTLSICTFGLVRFRNEKEKTLSAVRKSNKIAKRQLRQDRQQQPPQV